MRYRYFTCHVFTDIRFGGNQLAVLPEADGLSDEQMQQIAREFNFSETTFVLPAQQGHARRVRIFTPPREVPFAGHPNIGTAFVLARMGAFGALDEPLAVTFEEDAGLVPLAIHRREGERIWCELTAPQSLTLGQTVSPLLYSLSSTAPLSRALVLRQRSVSRMEISSSRFLFMRAISSFSMTLARTPFSEPRRLKMRTSMMVPSTPGAQ